MGTSATLTALKARHAAYTDGRAAHAPEGKTRLLLEVARTLSQPFALARLVVEAWRAHPREFGLRGYSDTYPDSNRVSAALMGRRGLVARGFLARVGPGRYRIRGEQTEVARPRKPAETCRHGQRVGECAVCNRRQ